MASKEAEQTEKKPADFRAGDNVFALVDGKEVGPIYVVQVFGGFAELQGADKHIVKVEDVLRVA